MSAAWFRRRDLLIATGLCILVPGSISPGGASPVAIARPSVPRRLKLKNVHTGETFEGPYRDDTGPIADAVTDLAHFLRQLPAGEPLLFVGLGSNLLVRDGGWRGTVVMTHTAARRPCMEGNLIYAEAGVASPKVDRKSVV